MSNLILYLLFFTLFLTRCRARLCFLIFFFFLSLVLFLLRVLYSQSILCSFSFYGILYDITTELVNSQKWLCCSSIDKLLKHPHLLHSNRNSVHSWHLVLVLVLHEENHMLTSMLHQQVTICPQIHLKYENTKNVSIVKYFALHYGVNIFILLFFN